MCDDLWSRGKIVNNYDVDATGGGLWTDTTHFKVTCPAGKRWFLLGGVAYRSDAATMTAKVFDSGAQNIQFLDSWAAAAGSIPVPSNQVAVTSMQALGNYVTVLEAGDYMELFFGAAQGATAFCALRMLEVDA